MPTISLPPRGQLATAPRHTRTDRSRPSLTVRAQVAAQRWTLTRELSEGADRPRHRNSLCAPSS